MGQNDVPSFRAHCCLFLIRMIKASGADQRSPGGQRDPTDLGGVSRAGQVTSFIHTEKPGVSSRGTMEEASTQP